MICMADQMTVTTELIDDVPVLLAQALKMDVPKLFDKHFCVHGNWAGTSPGWTVTMWLAHILSEGDHRLNQVEPWVAQRERVLQSSSGQAIRSLEWSDDRLGIMLDALSDAEKWQLFERELNQRTLRVYHLTPQRVRVDSTTTSGYWTVTEDGLFQFGHSKDHRPDLPQLKVMLSALDPLGMPLVTQIVSGESADDPLYIPAIQQVSQSLDEHGMLYVGDCKMAALRTRAFVQAQNDYYLCPLSETQLPDAVLEAYLRPVWQGEQLTTAIYRNNAAGEREKLAEGYEQNVSVTHEVNGKTINWEERRMIVRSQQYAEAAQKALSTRLAKAQAELQQLNEHKQGKRSLGTPAALQSAADAIVKRWRVAGLLTLVVHEHVSERVVRAYKDRATRSEIERVVTIRVDVDEQAVQEAQRWLGWRVYATNHPQETLPLDQAILAYRDEFLIEQGFGRLKGHPLSVTPMYLQSDKRATGLIRLLSIGLRMLTLLEYSVRQHLAEQKAKLAGLYAGNPKRATDHPSAELLLNAFKHVVLSVITIGEKTYHHVTSLSSVQTQILSLLGFPVEIYTQLASEFPLTVVNLTEP